MDENTDIWRKYYEKELLRPHSKRTAFAVTLNASNSQVAIDCGCGTGNDIEFLELCGYHVHGFDINPDAIAMCQDRFNMKPRVAITESSFESFVYPKAGVVIANSSLFFADPTLFGTTWNNIKSSVNIGGVFAGDFMGRKDDWAKEYRCPTVSLLESEVRSLFSGFDVVKFSERDEAAKTSLGRMKHWHTYSVIAVKCI
ncbi:class I SAM-dependent methyltransferase [Marinomonas sp. 2405UD68-3]|uniref:class I SAM-dependent methyltransferase n=1 Tax=Marinomonas sp. 2405UD68-3 TaxID=3391835 RepID=UPI0039C94519